MLMLPSSAKVNDAGNDIVGGSLTGVTITFVEALAVNEPSLTVKLRLSVPNQLAADVKVATSQR